MGAVWAGAGLVLLGLLYVYYTLWMVVTPLADKAIQDSPLGWLFPAHLRYWGLAIPLTGLVVGLSVVAGVYCRLVAPD